MTTAQQDTPERRYVWLHRAIERGNSTDSIWSELSRVCYRLGYNDEAIRGAQNIRNPETRRQAEMFLIQKGLMDRPSEVQQTDEAQRQHHRPTTQEEVADAVGYLFLEHMPLTVMAATLTFPLVLGLGGFLTVGSDLWVFPAIALLPVLSVVGIVGAMARKIMLEASRGADEPPAIPEVSKLAPAAARFLGDSVAVLGLFLLPGLLALQLGLHWGISVGLLTLGGALAPMGFALRQTRNDWRGLSPHLLVPAVARIGMPYWKLIVVTAVLFSPAVGATIWTVGSDLYLRLSFLGPLAIAPLFIASRLMGRTIFLSRDKLGELITDQTGQLDQELTSLAPERIEVYQQRQMSSRTAHKPRMNQRRHRLRNSARQPAAAHPEISQTHSTAAPAAVRREVRERVTQAVANSARKDQTEARLQAEREVLENTARRQRQHAERKQRRVDALHQEAYGASAHTDTVPDLEHIPGAKVLRGKERELAGAAATPRRRRNP